MNRAVEKEKASELAAAEHVHPFQKNLSPTPVSTNQIAPFRFRFALVKALSATRSLTRFWVWIAYSQARHRLRARGVRAAGGVA